MRIISNKKLIVMLGIVFLLSVVLAYYFTCPAHNTIRALNSGDSAKAVTQFSKVDDPLQRKLLSLLLPSTMENINNAYNVGDLSLQDTEKLYETVTLFKIGNISEYHDHFKELILSKQSYDKALFALDTLDYITAIRNYNNVIPADSLYDAAQQELQNATSKYKNDLTNKFYTYILNGNTDDAAKIIDEAMTVISDNDISSMKTNLSSGVYDKIGALLDNLDEWEIITQSHAGENTYCCYRIKVAKKDPNAFRCYYVTKSLNSLVQSGNVASIGGPVAWYEYDDILIGNVIRKLSYNQEKGLESGGYAESVSWNYTMSEIEKLKTLEELFS